MKVAIVGAGLSGLSCAYELEKNGITPVIYEKRSQVGVPLGFSGLWSRLLIRPNEDPIKYLKVKYGLDIKPLSSLNETTMISPKKKMVAKGNLGYTFRRGIEENSIENQIASKVKSPILFNSYMELNTLRNQFDRIVIASSSCQTAKQLNLWTDTFVSKARVAVILGDFKMSSAIVWFNEKYANKAFCYLIPNNLKEATLALIINDASLTELDYYWDRFMTMEGIKYTIIEQRDSEHFCGFMSSLQIDNIYFVGNAAGLTDDLIGIGGFNAIESGILAAQAIAENTDYNKLVKPIYDDIVKIHEFRKAMNTFDNSGFDKLLTFLGLPGIKQFIYRTPFLKLRYGTRLVKLYNRIKNNK